MRVLVLFVLLSFLLACNEQASTTAKSDTNVNGEQLFKVRCAQCHKPAQDFTGPMLKGAETRWPDKKRLYEFVRNPQASVVSDEYAKALFDKWNKAPMLPFPDLTDKDIDAILQYCATAGQ
ncbi:MAG TPA: cytochrome c [Ferruginibacter sp.]|nr:cytochrome c [Ferruginibacter sp.]